MPNLGRVQHGLPRKPNAGFSINKNHPICQGLMGAWLFEEHNAARFTDLVQWQPAGTIRGTPKSVPGNPQFRGLAGQFGTGSGGASFTVTRNGGLANTGDPISIIACVFPVVNLMNNQILISYGAVTDNNSFFCFGGDSSSHVSCTANVTASMTTFTIANGSWQTMGVAQSSATSRNFMLNSVIQANATNTGTTAACGGGLVVGTLYVSQAANAASDLDGNIAYLYVWNRKITNAEYFQIYGNPYQILLPAAPQRPSGFPSAAGFPTRPVFAAEGDYWPMMEYEPG